MIIRRIYFIAATLILFWGCQVTRDYQGVEPRNQVEEYPLEELTTDMISMAEMDIEELFDDDQLIELIKTAFANNFSLPQEVTLIEMTQAYYLHGKPA